MLNSDKKIASTVVVEIEHLNKLKSIVEDQDDYIQQLETQVVKMHQNGQQIEQQVDTYQELVNLFVQKFTDAAIKNKQRKVVDILLYEHFTALEKHIQSKPRVVNIPTDARSTEKKLIEQQAAVLN